MSAPRTFSFPDHDADSEAQLSRSPASSTGSRGGWLGRLRRNSNTNNSKGPSPAGSPRSTSPSFVVRSVVKQSGGVNAAGYVDADLRDSLAAVTLGVPIGGPGGGIGYGTAHSSNDGRPDGFSGTKDVAGIRSLSASPIAMNAGGFQQSIRQRQLSLRSRIDQSYCQQNDNESQFSSDNVHSQTYNIAGSPSGPRPNPVRSSARRMELDTQLYEPPGAVDTSLPSAITDASLPRDIQGSPSLHTGIGSRARTPFGSVSPGASPNFAAKVMRGIMGFGPKSPQYSDRDDGVYVDEGEWVRGSPGRSGSAAPYELPRRLTDEHEAIHQRAVSRLQATRIVDAERQAAIDAAVDGIRPVYNPITDRPWEPRQAIGSPDGLDSDTPANWAQTQQDGVPVRQPRKAVPHLTSLDNLETLQPMPGPLGNSLAEDGNADKDQSTLTPAQRIIQETRSKHLQEGGAGYVQSRPGYHPSPPVAKQIQHGFVPRISAAIGGNGTIKSEANTSRQDISLGLRKVGNQLSGADASSSDTSTGLQGGGGLVPGSGPTFADMSLKDGMQSLLVRFFRYERYSVPLIRALETRLLDIERDAQMAQMQDADTLSARSVEMDRWVNQIQTLIRHELGQLKAGCKEIRDTRELVAEIALKSGLRHGKQASSARPPTLSADPCTNITPYKEGDIVNLEPSSQSTISNARPKMQAAPQVPEPNANGGIIIEGEVLSNSSSSATAECAVPSDGNSCGVNREVRSTSPIGRPYYTNALKEPFLNGRLSPSRSHIDSADLCPPLPSYFAQSDAARAGAASPSLSDSSAGSVSIQQRDVSVEHRLKALISKSSLSQSTTSLPSSQLKTRHPNGSGIDTIAASAEAQSTSHHPNDLSHETSTTVRPSVRAQQLSLDSHKENLPTSTNTILPLYLRSPGDSQQTAGKQSSPSSRSNSPNLVPDTAGSTITTASRASNNLRARAQSYLQSADGRAASLATGSTWTGEPTSPAAQKNFPANTDMKTRVAFFSSQQ